jgi:hypothetical protein
MKYQTKHEEWKSHTVMMAGKSNEEGKTIVVVFYYREVKEAVSTWQHHLL